MNTNETKKPGKVPAYTQKAIDDYNARHKRITLFVSADDLERIRAAGIDNAVCKRLIFAELERRETENKQ